MASQDAQGWLVDDDRIVADLPEWVRAHVPDVTPRLVMTEHGLALTAWGKGTAASWEQVLGVTAVGSHAYVLVPRPPPHRPWLEITPGLLPEGMELRAFVELVRSRISERGYREHAAPSAPTLPRAEVAQRILARDAVRGALEIPIVSPGPKPWQRVLLALIAFGGGAYFGVFGGMMLLAVLAGISGNPGSPALLAVISVATGIAAAALALGHGRERRKRPPRVLALTPDGCVCGFPAGIRAFTWDEIDRFELERPGWMHHAPVLTVVGRDGAPAGQIDTRWLDAPAEIVVAVANEYRKRHRPAQAAA